MRFEDNGFDGVRVYSLRQHGTDYVGRFFRVNEFACRDGSDALLVHPALVVLLDTLRDEFGPIHINSAFRSLAHNTAIGGAPQSRHLYGYAADIVARYERPENVATFAEGLGAGGVGRYPAFTHVDVWGHDRRWSQT